MELQGICLVANYILKFTSPRPVSVIQSEEFA